MPFRPAAGLDLCVLLASSGLAPAAAAEPLAARVDQLIEIRAKADGVPLGPPADDAEFLRRTYLDFAGHIPSASVARAFLADADPGKREKLIDHLLAGPDYPARMADLFHVMLMEQLGDHPAWAGYLRTAFAKNKSWDRMAREILRADPKDADAAGAAFFLAKRLENYGQNPVDYSGLTRDVGRLLLGKNLQCCECHDHLLVEDYKQKDFQGLHAFFRNAVLVDGPKLLVGERPTTGKTSFTSVLTKMMTTTGPAVPGLMMVDVPTFPKGAEFAEPPDRKTNSPGVPKFRTLAAVSDQLPRAANRDFARNMANRLWFVLMGRGLVHPLDLHHSRNPGSHPELLTLLADEFTAHRFDIKWLLRELARTKTYQRSGLVPAGRVAADPWYFATALERRLTPEQIVLNTLTATGTDLKAAAALRPKFVKAFANQPREPADEIEPSLKGALFLSNDAAVLALLKPTANNLVGQLAKLPDDRVADELYLAVLTRKPTADEVATVTAELRKAPSNKPTALGQLAWALLASTEFGVNH